MLSVFLFFWGLFDFVLFFVGFCPFGNKFLFIQNKKRNLISEKAAALMEGSLKNRGFIAERGLKNIISPFDEVLERRE